jgi:environmental stress-induced protein Ves
LRIIRARDCRTTPWKNGGGATTEIVAAPEGASLETFDWRISMAQVTRDGPFSEFSGIDRSLAVIEGSGMLLTVGSRAPMMLSSNTAPVSFAGDTPTSAQLTSGAVVDLNVMTRRERFSHRLHHIQGPVPCSFEDGDDFAVVVSRNGRTTITCERNTATLDHNDAAVVDRKDDINFRILPETGKCYLILLREQHAR